MSKYEKHTFPDSRLPFIILTFKYSAINQISVGNWHENVELLYITKGNGVIRINDHSITVREGDIVVVNQNRIHSIIAMGDLHYFCVIVDRSFCLANHFDTNKILFDEYLRDARVAEMIEEIVDEYKARDKNAYSVQAIRATVLRVMTVLCREYSRPDDESFQDTHLLSCIKQAIGCINSESHRDISLDEIADFVGLSKYYFAREFKNITGYTFVSYLNIVRCEKAKALLTQTYKSIGSISTECGFTDQSYFTRVFKKYVGVLPAEFKTRKC